VKVKDLMDLTSPRYRRYFGHKTEVFDKKGNPKLVIFSAPEITDYKVLKRKRKHKNRDWTVIKRLRLRYGADAVLSFNKKSKVFKVDIFYRTVSLYFYFTAKEVKDYISL